MEIDDENDLIDLLFGVGMNDTPEFIESNQRKLDEIYKPHFLIPVLDGEQLQGYIMPLELYRDDHPLSRDYILEYRIQLPEGFSAATQQHFPRPNYYPFPLNFPIEPGIEDLKSIVSMAISRINSPSKPTDYSKREWSTNTIKAVKRKIKP